IAFSPVPKGFSLEESLMLSWIPACLARSSAETPGTYVWIRSSEALAVALIGHSPSLALAPNRDARRSLLLGRHDGRAELRPRTHGPAPGCTGVDCRAQGSPGRIKAPCSPGPPPLPLLPERPRSNRPSR